MRGKSRERETRIVFASADIAANNHRPLVVRVFERLVLFLLRGVGGGGGGDATDKTKLADLTGAVAVIVDQL